MADHCLKLLLVQSIESESGSGPNHRTDLLLPFLQGYRPIAASRFFYIIFCLLDFCLSFLLQLACERIICKNYLPCCRPGHCTRCRSCSCFLIALRPSLTAGRAEKIFFSSVHPGSGLRNGTGNVAVAASSKKGLNFKLSSFIAGCCPSGWRFLLR